MEGQMNYAIDFPAFLRGNDIVHFSAREICPVGKVNNGATLKAPPCVLWQNIIPTLKVLEWLRAKINEDMSPREQKPIIVTSGYRDIAYNRAVGSNDQSQHPRFTAIDFRVPGMSPRAIAALLETHPASDTFGIGVYPTFTHIDTRGTRARW